MHSTIAAHHTEPAKTHHPRAAEQQYRENDNHNNAN
jgi:hypothetical protein